jgi:hypothetical protein
MRRFQAKLQDRDAKGDAQKECVKVVIGVPGEKEQIYSLTAYAAGGQRGELGGDPKWHGEWIAAVSTSDTAWLAEYRIPLSDLGMDAGVVPCVKINFARERYTTGFHDKTSWSRVPSDFEDWRRMGELMLPDADGGYYQVGLPSPRNMPAWRVALDAKVTNHTDRLGKLKFLYDLTDRQKVSGEFAIGEAAAAETKTLPLAFPDAEPGEHALVLRLVDSESGRTLFTQSRVFDVPPPLVVESLPYYQYTAKAEADIYVSLSPSASAGTELVVSVVKTGDESPVAVMKYDRLEQSPIRASLDMERAEKGAYTIQAEIRHGDRQLASAKSSPLSYNPRPRVGFDASGYLTVEGKPFFPIGIYQIATPNGDDSQVKEAAEAGFNTAVWYDTGLEAIKEKMDICHRHGIKSFIYPTAPFVSKKGNETRETIIEDIKARMDHPGLLGWYVADEPEGIGKATVDMVRGVYDLIKSIDSDHPCSMVIMSPDAAKMYGRGADVVWVDPYPLPGKPVTFVSEALEGVVNAVESVEKNKPAWVVPQAFDWAIWWSGALKDGIHRPTPAEDRCMTYLAVVHGAKGVLYWAHSPSRYKISDYPEHWSMIKRLAGEMKKMSPILVTPTSKTELTITPTTATIDSMVKDLGAETYVIAVNRTARAQEAVIGLPNPASESNVEVMFEERTLTPVNGRWADRFEPLDVHVYRTKRR